MSQSPETDPMETPRIQTLVELLAEEADTSQFSGYPQYSFNESRYLNYEFKARGGDLEMWFPDAASRKFTKDLLSYRVAGASDTDSPIYNSYYINVQTTGGRRCAELHDMVVHNLGGRPMRVDMDERTIEDVVNKAQSIRGIGHFLHRRQAQLIGAAKFGHDNTAQNRIDAAVLADNQARGFAPTTRRGAFINAFRKSQSTVGARNDLPFVDAAGFMIEESFPKDSSDWLDCLPRLKSAAEIRRAQLLLHTGLVLLTGSEAPKNRIDQARGITSYLDKTVDGSRVTAHTLANAYDEATLKMLALLNKSKQMDPKLVIPELYLRELLALAADRSTKLSNKYFPPEAGVYPLYIHTQGTKIDKALLTFVADVEAGKFAPAHPPSLETPATIRAKTREQKAVEAAAKAALQAENAAHDEPVKAQLAELAEQYDTLLAPLAPSSRKLREWGVLGGDSLERALSNGGGKHLTRTQLPLIDCLKTYGGLYGLVREFGEQAPEQVLGIYQSAQTLRKLQAELNAQLRSGHVAPFNAAVLMHMDWLAENAEQVQAAGAGTRHVLTPAQSTAMNAVFAHLRGEAVVTEPEVELTPEVTEVSAEPVAEIAMPVEAELALEAFKMPLKQQEVAVQLDWEVFPADVTVEMIKDATERTFIRRASKVHNIEWERIGDLIELAEAFDGELYRSKPRSLGATLPYFVTVINVDGHEFVVGENPQYGNASYILRTDLAAYGASWQEIFEQPRAFARLLGAERVVHTQERRHIDRIMDVIQSQKLLRTQQILPKQR